MSATVVEVRRKQNFNVTICGQLLAIFAKIDSDKSSWHCKIKECKRGQLLIIEMKF
jgi:hypothetical protein